MSNWQIRRIPDRSNTIELRYGIFSKQDDWKRAVIFSNGRTEWIEKYPHIPEWLHLPDDCAFVTWDHRGQGASGGERGFVDSYDQYVDDASVILDAVLQGRPYAMMAHSMGSLIALYGHLKGVFAPEQLVLCSPLFRLPEKPIPSPVARPLAKLIHTLGWGYVSTGAGQHDQKAFKRNKLTHDEATYRRIKSTAYRVPSACFSWVHQTVVATDYIHDPVNLKNLRTPLAVIYGSDERVVHSPAIPEWVELARGVVKQPIELATIEGARHELFSESAQYRDLALAKVRGWLSRFLEAVV